MGSGMFMAVNPSLDDRHYNLYIWDASLHGYLRVRYWMYRKFVRLPDSPSVWGGMIGHKVETLSQTLGWGLAQVSSSGLLD